MKDKPLRLWKPKEVQELLAAKYGTAPSSVILSDYCYNRTNRGARLRPLFQYITKSTYIYLGPDYPYTGSIVHKAKGQEERIIGRWENGDCIMYDGFRTSENISRSHLLHMYEQYSQMLREEMNLFGCKATELRHLVGRIGEFYCALLKNGTLAREVNQHGFDVVAEGRYISVKSTAQTGGFIILNPNTFDQFDDLFVVQFKDDDFHILFDGPKESVRPLVRESGSSWEIDLSKL